jgi:hypothetical protein
MVPVYNYLANGELPSNKKEATTVRHRACATSSSKGNYIEGGFPSDILIFYFFLSNHLLP